jgi:hypothetical protein
MLVKAKQGTVCPRADGREPPINDREPQAVPDAAYYRRRLADGSLVRVAGAIGAPKGGLVIPSDKQDADDKPKAGKGKA